MDLKVKTSPKGFEVANCILGQAIKELEAGEGSLLWIGLSKADIEAAKRFSNAVKKAFFALHKK